MCVYVLNNKIGIKYQEWNFFVYSQFLNSLHLQTKILEICCTLYIIIYNDNEIYE